MPFRTVRAAGNAAYPGGELFSNAGVGAVAYEYRIAEREVTTTEWLEFVGAYTPHYTGNPEVPGLSGNWFRYDFARGSLTLSPVPSSTRRICRGAWPRGSATGCTTAR